MVQTDAFGAVADSLSDVGGVDRSEVTPEKTFAELGIDSFTMLEVVVAAEDRLGMLIPDDDWSGFRTVGDAARYIEQVAIPAAESPFARADNSGKAPGAVV